LLKIQIPSDLDSLDLVLGLRDLSSACIGGIHNSSIWEAPGLTNVLTHFHLLTEENSYDNSK
jgi:hypothetical protein